MDLAINIIYILYSFSNFSQFHQLLQQAHVGDNIMRLIDLEIQRQAVRDKEKQKEKERQQGAAAGSGADGAEERERQKRQKLVVRKQEKLLYVCFHVLLNLAEEPATEKKMAKRGIVRYLVAMLPRQNIELQVLVLIFLKKLAIFKENLPDLKKNKVALLLVPLVASPTEALQVSALRLLFNISFEPSGREAIVQGGLIPKLSKLLRQRQINPLIVRLLYHASAEKEGRALLGASDIPAVVRKHIMSCGELQLPSELVALAINLAFDEKAAEVLGEAGALRHMLERLLQTQDVLLLKLLRGLAAHEGPAQRLAPYTADLVQLLQQLEMPELLVELLGMLGALPLHCMPELPRIAHKYDLVDLLQRHLTPGYTEDDVLLEVIVLIGSLAGSEQLAATMADTRILRSLYLLITEKQEDDELVLQILFALYRFLQADESRQSLLSQTQLVIYLLDLLLDKSSAIRKMSASCLDVVAEFDEHWASQIRQRKFQMHNKEWLEVIDEDEAEEYEDAVALNNAMSHLQLNQPLDASQLELDDDGMEPPSPAEDSFEEQGYGEQGYGEQFGYYSQGGVNEEAYAAGHAEGTYGAQYDGAMGYGEPYDSEPYDEHFDG